MTRIPTSAPDPGPTSTGTTGLWVVRSDSATEYYVDFDRRLVLRHPGPGSAQGATDDRWVPLVQLNRLVVPTDGRPPYLERVTIITVGYRHHYLLDPGRSDYQWWLQRTVTRLDRIVEPDLPISSECPPSR